MFTMESNAGKEEIAGLCNAIKQMGLQARRVNGEHYITIHPIGDEEGVNLENLASMPGVKSFKAVQGRYKIIARENHEEYAGNQNVMPITIGSENPVTLGNGELIIIAGPCAVQTYDQTYEVAMAAKEAGAQILRGGTLKPRSSAHSNMGALEERTEILIQVGKDVGMPVMTEVLDQDHVSYLNDKVDAMWTGARRAVSDPLYRHVGSKSKVPVLIKNNIYFTNVGDWLASAEYVAKEGNTDIALIYRGELGEASSNRDGKFNSKAILFANKESVCPIIVDPSHSAGRTWMVESLIYSSVALPGVKGLMIEVIPEGAEPGDIETDYQQALRPSEFGPIVQRAKEMYAVVHAEK
ncbi:hypothetical protein GF345_00970 [Candidatus Woesearchaeota archaeon]|nr:hypothetical protein [Candidatus Woesearchaeota archaeon]